MYQDIVYSFQYNKGVKRSRKGEWRCRGRGKLWNKPDWNLSCVFWHMRKAKALCAGSMVSVVQPATNGLRGIRPVRISATTAGGRFIRPIKSQIRWKPKLLRLEKPSPQSALGKPGACSWITTRRTFLLPAPSTGYSDAMVSFPKKPATLPGTLSALKKLSQTKCGKQISREIFS